MSYKTEFSPNSRYSKLLIIRFTAYSRSPNCSYIQTRKQAHKFCWDFSIINVHNTYFLQQQWNAGVPIGKSRSYIWRESLSNNITQVNAIVSPTLNITGTLQISSVCSFPLVIILCCNFYAFFFTYVIIVIEIVIS